MGEPIVKTTLLTVALLSLVYLSGCAAEPRVAPTSAVSEPQAASAKASAGALEVTYLANFGGVAGSAACLQRQPQGRDRQRD